MAISFFSEDTSFTLKEKNRRKKWLRSIASEKGRQIKDLNYILCSDEYLWQINMDYLNHNDYTDIITFDSSENENEISGDIFISIERVKENASKLNVEEEEELSRVISHGLLHLLGYKDKSPKESKEMRAQEDRAINLYESI
ncbi:rRNA maturation RNase YbeY [Algoriphagus namhaensis]|uniref:Endoribonuclease YbeY n=1 Tax=Algoriphagus namhaensis TaxID=915353 RepID=A0ABV8ASM9_9BACT